MVTGARVRVLRRKLMEGRTRGIGVKERLLRSPHLLVHPIPILMIFYGRRARRFR
jgi:hypothetical protein